MEHSTNSASLSSLRGSRLEQSFDWTILATGALVIIGAIIAIYAVTVSSGADQGELATMVAFP
jgi:hypothetical protein